MLKNAYLLAKIGFDTAEIEDLDARLESLFHRQSLEGHRAHDHVNGALIPGAAVQSLDELRVRPDRVISVGHDTSLFPRLVLGCITADFGHQIVIFQHFSRSTRFAHFCTARNSKFWRTLSYFSRNFRQNYENFDENSSGAES